MMIKPYWQKWLCGGITSALLITLPIHESKAQSHENFYRAAEWGKAVQRLQEELKEQPGNPGLLRKLGFAYFTIAHYPQADSVYSVLTETENAVPLDYFQHGIVLMRRGMYAQAKEKIQKYQSLEPISDSSVTVAIKSCDLGLEAQKKPTRYKFQLVRKLSTDKNDYAPVKGDRQLIFVSREPGLANSFTSGVEQQSPRVNQPLSRFYTVDFDNDKISSRVRLFDPTFTEGVDYGPLVFSADMQTMYFTRGFQVLNPNGEATTLLKIYQTENRNGSWSKPKPLPFNSDRFSCAHPALSPDGQTLYFASDRMGKKSGTKTRLEADFDIYTVTRKPKGKGWTKPVPLTEVNTPGNEAFPAIDSTGTLCFASDFHPGRGGYDIFSKAKGGPIVNMLDFNSPQDDIQLLFLNKDKSDGFLVSNRVQGMGGFDIYRFASIAPQPAPIPQPDEKTDSLPTILDNAAEDTPTPIEERSTEEAPATIVEPEPPTLPTKDEGDGPINENLPTPQPEPPKPKPLPKPLKTCVIPCERDTVYQLPDGRWVTISSKPCNENLVNNTTEAESPIEKVGDLYLLKGIIVERIISRENYEIKETGWMPPLNGTHIRVTKGEQLIAAVSVNKQDGNFVLKLPEVNTYDLTVLEDNTEYEIKRLQITEADFKRKKRIELEKVVFPIFFGNDIDAVAPSYQKELAEVRKWLNKNKELSVQILAYASKAGNAAYNVNLSLRRANSVEKALNIEPKTLPSGKPRLEKNSFGESKARASDDNNLLKQSIDRVCEIVVRANDNQELQLAKEDLKKRYEKQMFPMDERTK